MPLDCPVINSRITLNPPKDAQLSLSRCRSRSELITPPDPRTTFNDSPIPLRTAIAAIAGIVAIGYSVYTGLAWTSVVLVCALAVAALPVAHRWDQTRLVIEILWIMSTSRRALELIGEVTRAQQLSESGELAEAVMVLDAVAEEMDSAQVAMLEMLHTQVRGMVAGAQGNLVDAERWLQRAAVLARRRQDRSAFAEITEQLAKFRIAQGEPEAAYRGLKEAVETGGGLMYRLSRVRAELQMANAAAQMGEDDLAYRHSMETRRLALKWRCHEQRGLACCILAIHAMVYGDLEQARRWSSEALTTLSQSDASAASWVDPLVTAGKVADARGELTEALHHYRQALGIVATERVKWGDRSAQAYTVGLRQVVVSYAFQVAYARCARGDEAALGDFAELFSLVNQTNLRGMLRSGASFTDQRIRSDAQEIGRILAVIEQAETDIAKRSQTSGLQTQALYERLESLVSLRFRRAMEGPVGATAADSRRWSSEWRTHLLEISVLIDETTVQIASLWTDPDGKRVPSFTTLNSGQVRLLAAMTLSSQLEGAASSNATEMDSPVEGVRSDVGASGIESVRSGGRKWIETEQFAYVAGSASEPWRELASALLPTGLLERLRKTNPDSKEIPRLLIVPDSTLWRIPWGAIQLNADETPLHLSDAAVLALLPSLHLLDADKGLNVPSATARGAVAYLRGIHPDGMEIEHQSLKKAFGEDFDPAESDQDLLASLQPGEAPRKVVAVSVHGNNKPGLAHGLRLTARQELSAARMLNMQFPPTFMINACLSADLDERRGTDPLGIPTVALCRGAREVIGGIFPIPDGPARRPDYSHSSALILADLYGRLAAGEPAPEALRHAQRAWRASRPEAPPWLWAGLTCITIQHDGGLPTNDLSRPGGPHERQ